MVCRDYIYPYPLVSASKYTLHPKALEGCAELNHKAIPAAILPIQYQVVPNALQHVNP